MLIIPNEKFYADVFNVYSSLFIYENVDFLYYKATVVIKMINRRPMSI